MIKPTHFISIPLKSKEFIQKVDEFIEFASSTTNVDPMAFMGSSRMHLTLFVLSLDSQEKLETASEINQSLINV